ncbi:UBX domain containing protein [Trypanosoma theileri]|uniref:UBX domain containing protein n=1 Tax=Trypanosoma theileri TaxID=67003 RepID=A0A1X0P6W3_9TRYP|nr:UBX domain containing protein [Trypanosoma theileri]ORC92329.1 UBX domain containing protein [Trypanosoma theileri]
MSLASEIQHQYGVELPFLNCTFEEARREAQRRALYLLVYLHCPTHENTHNFVTDVLSNPQLREEFESRFLLFGASVLEAAGHKLEIELQATTFPFIAVILKRNTVLKLKGLYTAEEILQNFRMMFDHWDGTLAQEISVRQEREEKERTRREEERRTLEIESIDRERLRQYDERERRRREIEAEQQRKREAMEEQQREEERARAEQERREMEQREQQQREEAERRARREQLKAKAQTRLPVEPPGDAEASTIAVISLKSLCGVQYQRRFYRSDPLQSLYDYAVTLQDYDGTNFQLVTGYPPCALDLDKNLTFNDVPALLPRAVVIMRSI